MESSDSSKSSPVIEVAPGPHVHDTALTTQRMMIDVLIALAPLVAVALIVFGKPAAVQIVLCMICCLVAEAFFQTMRGKEMALHDGSALVTGLILALSLPATAPGYVALIASFVAIGMGKVIFGGLGHNIFNPAMVGRAFAMINFPTVLGATAYIAAGSGIDALTRQTPLTAFKMEGISTPLTALMLGTTNGSLGETSALACLIGGIYLCSRKTASWQIPVGCLLAVMVVAGSINLVNLEASWTVVHELCGGALLFGAFFIATDPVSSPITPCGKWIFGIGFGLFVMLLRKLSGYPEGVMFAVLIMNAVTPLINRWTIPAPIGGPVPERK